jgi:hypothetical protein
MSSTTADAGKGNLSFNVMQMYTLHGGALALIQEEKSLTEYLVSVNLIILNLGKESTFVTCKRKEVLNLKLETNKPGNLVTGMYLMSLQAHTLSNR